ncbi:MAG: hypothetical protein IJU56_00090 [Clostridia bacterium]|nr:hypothetical protein [Clostridia bacterium]
MEHRGFESAVECLPAALREKLLLLPEGVRAQCFEIRLRKQQPVVLFGAFGCGVLQSDGTLGKTAGSAAVICTGEQLDAAFHCCCEYSVYAHENDLLRGFLTFHGNRVGLVGSAVCDAAGSMTAVRDITGLNVRVARDVPGCARALLGLFRDGAAQSVILAGPPASGKTTMLRDLIVSLSSLEHEGAQKLCVIDARQELFVAHTALNCDFYRGYPMEIAIDNAVKTMSPQLIVCDEIATKREVDAICYGVNCGVRFLVGVHASSKAELLRRTQVQRLLETRAFDRAVLLASAPVGTVSAVLAGRTLFDA